jgi:hypothetical protein
MFAKNKRLAAFIGILALVGVIPHLLHGADTENFTPHIVMMIPFLLIFIGYGIHEFIYLMFPKYKRILFVTVVGIYVISLGNFLQIYWFQYPLNGQFDFPIRVLTKYLEFQKSDRQVLVYIARHEELFKRYLFYSNGINSRTIFTIRKIYDANIIPYKNVIFMGCDERFTIPENTTVVYDSQCNKPLLPDPFVKIKRLNDGGDTFKIYNDIVCVNYQLKPYVSNITLGELAIESLNEKTFCETYIAK